MAGVVQMFVAPPFVSPEPVVLQRKDPYTGEFVDLHTGTVQIVCVKDSPEMRQLMIDVGGSGYVPLHAPDNGHYDFVIVHDAFVPTNRTPVAPVLQRDDRIVRRRKNDQILKVTYDYLVENYVQLVWAVYLPAQELRPKMVGNR